MTATCAFCAIRDGEQAAAMVLDDENVLAFLDRRPLFHGHVLVIPREHHATIFDLPTTEVAPLFEATQRIARAVRSALVSDGVFIASNNGVSQSVDHLHIHVVPRRKKDGLRGFMWPRTSYTDETEAEDIARRIREAL